MDIHQRIWAKEIGLDRPYPLLAHLLDTAAIAKQLYMGWLRPGLREQIAEDLADGDQTETVKIIAYIAGTHDIGKANPYFQAQPRNSNEAFERIRAAILQEEQCTFLDEDEIPVPPSAKPYLTRHERVGAIALSPKPLEAGTNLRRAWWGIPALGHHGRFTEPAEEERQEQELERILVTRNWEPIQRDLLEAMKTACGISELPRLASGVTTVLLAGLVILADRIASGTDWVQARANLAADGQISLEKPKHWIDKAATSALERIKNTLGIYKGWENQQAAIAEILGGNQPRPLQEEAMRVGGGIWNVMAPTGGGKTEAAILRHSTRDERLIFLLPTQATSNALMRRIHKIYEHTPNVAALAHGLASVEDLYAQPVTVASDKKEGGLYYTDFVKSGSSRLLAPICVGTVDQGLLATLPAKWTHLRLLALANAHVVIDEAHTLDPYQTKLVENLLEWLRATNTRVTLLTATLPSQQRTDFLNAYCGKPPTGKTHFPASENLQVGECEGKLSIPTVREYKIAFTTENIAYDALVSNHVTWVKKMRAKYPKARIGIICNTVERAQKVAKEIGEHTIILHSRMTAEHRRQNAELLEKTIGPDKKGEGLTVVGTQAIEASLDIDLDVMRTELCPAPSLIQRAGRVWRREDINRSLRIPGAVHLPMTVVKIDNDAGFQVRPYFDAELSRTWKWLNGHHMMKMPDDCQDFIDYSKVTLDTIVEDFEGATEQLADEVLKAQEGLAVANKLGDLTKKGVTLGTLIAMTAPKESSENEASTRFIKRNTIQCILGDPTGVIPGGWGGSAERLLAARGSDQELIKAAMRGSIPIPEGSKYAAILAEKVALTQSKSLLAGYYFIPNALQFYDPNVGLTVGDN